MRWTDFDLLAGWCSSQTCRPFKAKIAGANPVPATTLVNVMLYSFTFYNYQTKGTQSVTASDWNDAWRQLSLRFGSRFLRGTFQPQGDPIPVGDQASASQPKNERAPYGTGWPVIFGTGA